jgi:hypothetical protein
VTLARTSSGSDLALDLRVLAEPLGLGAEISSWTTQGQAPDGRLVLMPNSTLRAQRETRHAEVVASEL